MYPKCEYLSGYHRIHSWKIINALPALFHYKYKSLKKLFSKLSFLTYKTECAYIFFLEQQQQKKSKSKQKKKGNLRSYLLIFYCLLKVRTYLVCSQTYLRTCHCKIPALRRGRGHKFPPLTKSYRNWYLLGKGKSIFFPMECHWIGQPHSRQGLVPRSNWPAQHRVHDLVLFLCVHFCFAIPSYWFSFLSVCFDFCFSCFFENEKEKYKVWWEVWGE